MKSTPPGINFSPYSLVCPAGLTWLSQQGCAAVIDEALSKADALAKCQEKNPNAHLMMPKTENDQNLFIRLASGKNYTNNFFLGMSKINNQWYWDDGSPVFVMRKINFKFIYCRQ